MDLQLASGRLVRDATSDDILAHLDGEDFAILSTGPQSYIQCGAQNEPPYEYDLEYRDGSQDSHYTAVDSPITLDRVISAFIRYLQGDPEWRSRFRWERIEFP